jgi:hypothetical protein
MAYVGFSLIGAQGKIAHELPCEQATAGKHALNDFGW